MRWQFAERAEIEEGLRETFEMYGAITMQILLATNQTSFRYKGSGSLYTVENVLPSLLKWLREQHQRTEQKETWQIVLDIAITVFVLGETALTAYQLFCRH